MNQVEITLELHKLNRKWFESNNHLSNEQMLAVGLIDECDLVWINRFRKENSNDMARI